jgi:hypothetical protein
MFITDFLSVYACELHDVLGFFQGEMHGVVLFVASDLHAHPRPRRDRSESSGKYRQRRLDKIEQAMAPRQDMGAALGIAARPEALRGDVVTFVEQRIEGFEYKRLVLFCEVLVMSFSTDDRNLRNSVSR